MGYGLQRIYAGVVHTINVDIVCVLSIDDDVVLSRTPAVMAVVYRQYGHGALVDVCSRRERRGAQRKRYDFIGGGLWRFYARVVHTIDGDIVCVLSIDDDVVLSRTSAVMAVACRQYGHGALVDVRSRHE